MKRGYEAPGYTIIEVLIFLAISSGMFVAAYITFGSQHRRTEFATGMRDIELIIQDVINDVSTGYYARSTNDFRCRATVDGPQIIGGTSVQGTSQECTFIGRAMQFGVDGNRGNFVVFDIIGNRLAWDTPNNATDLIEAQPQVLDAAPVAQTLPAGLQVESIRAETGASTQFIGTVAFISTFGGGFADTSQSGSQSIDLYPIYSVNSISDLDQPPGAAATQIHDLISGAYPESCQRYHYLLVRSCLDNYIGEVTIGQDRGRTTTKTQVKAGVCPPQP